MSATQMFSIGVTSRARLRNSIEDDDDDENFGGKKCMLVKITKLVRVGNEARESEEFIFNIDNMIRAYNGVWTEDGFEVHCIKVQCVDGSVFYMSYKAATKMLQDAGAPTSIWSWCSGYYSKADVDLA